MKKLWWWYVLAVLLILAIMLAVLNWRFVSTAPDEELILTPRAVRELTVQAPLRLPPPDIAAIANSCIFDPERGRRKEVVAEAPPAERPNFELVGITRLNEESGAIIENKNLTGTDPKKSRRYYLTGSEVGNGFVLDAVQDNLVILKRDGEILELKIGRQRTGDLAKGQASLQKIAAEIQAEAVPPLPPGETIAAQAEQLPPPGAAMGQDSREAK